MKKIIIVISFFTIAFAQISMNDINGMNNAQLDLIKDQLKTPESVSDLDTEIDIQTAKPSIVNVSNLEDRGIESNLEDRGIEKTSLDSKEATFYSEFFGYDYFNREINFFDNISSVRIFFCILFSSSLHNRRNLMKSRIHAQF